MKIIAIVKGILAWVAKNVALIVGIIEAIAKLLAGIFSLTATKTDDKWIPMVDKVASAIKKALYTLSDKLKGTL